MLSAERQLELGLGDDLAGALADAHVAHREDARVAPVGVVARVLVGRGHGLQLGDERPELLLAEPRDVVLEGLAVLALRDEAGGDAVDHLGDPLGRHRADRQAVRAGVLAPAPAEHHLEVRHGDAVDLAAVAEEADVGHVVLAARVEAAADLDPQAADRLVELELLGGEPRAQLAGQAARRRDAELAGVGARAGGDVDDRPGAGRGEVDRLQLRVERRQVVLGDPAQHDVLLDRRADGVADVLAGDVGRAARVCSEVMSPSGSATVATA